MNNSTEPMGAPGLSVPDSAKRVPSRIRTNIHLPKKIYEALPAAYVSAGVLFVLGAVYIGIGHWLTVGYLSVGITCILAGVAVDSLRRKMRSKPRNALV